MFDKAAWQRQRIADRRSKGLCATCGSPSVKYYCAACAYKKSLYNKHWYWNGGKEHYKGTQHARSVALAAEGKCPRCAAPLNEGEEGYCFACKAGWQKNVKVIRSL